jgi:gliding motility-associated-like protein
LQGQYHYYGVFKLLSVALSVILFTALATESIAQPGCPYVTGINSTGQGVSCTVNCVDLTADFFTTATTANNYTVESIPFTPPVPLTGGTALFVGQDDIWGSAINLPFNFCFFGNTFNQVVVGANGLVSFNAALAGQGCNWSFTESIPHPNLYGNSIMGAYHDINPNVLFTNSGTISYAISGTAPCRIFAVTFNNVPHYSCDCSLFSSNGCQRTTQQIVIYETTNIIEVYLHNKPVCSAWNGGRAVVGIQNANSTIGFTPPGRNTGNWTASNEAWRFLPSGAPDYSFRWLQGTNVIATTPNVNVCPSAATTYTAEVTYNTCDGNVVVVTDQVTVDYNNTMSVSITPSNPTLCPGESVQLTASTATPGVTYTWSPALGLSATSGAVVTASPSATSTYTVTASDGSCSASSNVVVTIDDNCCETNTPPIIGPPAVCSNSTGNVYTVSNTVGSTYAWTVPAGATITSGQGTNSITVTFGGTGGNVTVVETISCGAGPVVTFAVSVTPSPVLTISDPASVCAPATVDITAASVTAGSTGGGTLTYWSNAGATVPLANPSAVSSSGIYYIRSASGTCFDIEPVTVTIDNCESCLITTLGLTVSDCYIANGLLQYDVQGAVAYVDPPQTGTLTITNCFGQQQIFNAPFGVNQNVSFPGMPQNGQNCDFVAVFSDDPACTATTGIAAPPAVTFFTSNCIIGSGVVNGSIEFSNAPSTGTLVITINDGTSTQQTVIQPPFVSPQQWTVNGLDPASGTYSITYYFSDYAGCAQTQNVTCGCGAEAGSTTVLVNGTPTLNPVLCEDDQLVIMTNNNFVHPDDEGPIGPFAYQPALVYLLFNCPPTPGMFPGDDPCLVGVIPVPENIGDINDANSLVAQVPPGTFTNGQVYVAPITLYHFDPITPNFIVNANCWDLGTVTLVTYLQPIVSNATANCQTASVSVNVSGGLPANNGSVFTASALLPNTASFVNTTAANNAAFVVSGLQEGDMYSFVVNDASGCGHQVSGGPFVALPLADAGQDDTSCSLSYQLAPVPSYGAGSWSGGPAGTTFGPNASTPNALVTVPTDGVYTFTWTEDNGNGCVNADDVQITFAQMSIPAVITGASCGVSDGEVSVSPSGGAAPYTYSWSSGGNGTVETGLPAGPVTVTVTDATGCSLDSTFIITMPNAFTFTTTANAVSCFGVCDATASIAPSGSVPYTYVWTPNVSSTNTASALCAGSYQVEITEDGGCVQTTTVVIGTPAQLNAEVSTDDASLCIGQSADLSAVITGGTPPYAGFQWTAVPADPSLVATQQNPTVSPLVSTVYSFVTSDANGCASVPKQVQVNVLPPLTLTITRPLAGPDTSICLHDSATLNALASGGDGNYSIYLLPNATVPVALPMTVSPSSTTSYDFVVTDGCTTPPASATSVVTVMPLPQVNFVGDILSGCHPQTVQFTDLTQPAVALWSWNFGDAGSGVNTSTSANPFHAFSAPGSYDISLSTWSAAGCMGDTTFTAYVVVHPNPVAQFDLTPIITNLLNADISFTDGSSNTVSNWSWDFGDGIASTQRNPSHQYGDTGTFIITLTVTTVHGCTDMTQRELLIEPDFTFYIPNAFTPNNNRKNEAFRPYGEGVDWTSLQFYIYTRWGEQIYYTADIESPWDGTFKGSPVESGVYVYRIDINDLKGEGHSYKGKVILLR